MKTHNQKGFIIPLLIGIIAILIIGGAYAWYSPFKKVGTTRTETIDGQTYQFQDYAPTWGQKGVRATSTASTTDATKDWKTHTDTKFGFTFQYPQNIQFVGIEAEDGANATMIRPDSQTDAMDIFFGCYHGLDNVNLGLEIPVPRKSFFDLMTDPHFSNTQKISFLGNDAFTAIYRNKDISYESVEIYIWHNGDVCSIGYNKNEAEQTKSTREKIISTFKFTN